MAVPTEIPGPRGLPLIGNILDLQDEVPLSAVERIADAQGPIFKIRVMQRETIFVAGYELFNELCDETRFYKLTQARLSDLGGKDGIKAKGLFTAPSEKEEDWGQAHRILMPAFGPLAVAEMFPEMHDIASQLILKWARLGPQHKIPVTDDFSRLTLDSIALCAMDFRFNSFYHDDMHAYIQAMNVILNESNRSGQLGEMVSRLLSSSHGEEVAQSRSLMADTARELVQHRRDHPTEKKDLLNSLIHGRDPKTGSSMRDELIAANMQTFLIAGHETTSGLLSFAFLQLLKNPAAYRAAQEEVDRVVGRHARIEPKHIADLKYINAVLRETLRLTPTAPGFARAVRPENTEETVYIGGKDPNATKKYEIPRNKPVTCLLGKIHRDKTVWGEDAEDFRPERMLDEEFEKLPKNAWKPFGTGMRACIGRAFAWQEAVLAVALILQTFDLTLDDPTYELKIAQNLTIKPKDFFMRASLREGLTPTILMSRLSGQNTSITATSTNGAKGNTITATPSSTADKHHDLTILYGSNTGTCQSLAQRLSAQAAQRGFQIESKPLNQALADDNGNESLSKATPTVIITASYEGQPTDDAAQFFLWLQNLKDTSNQDKALKRVRYAVFGCGHSDWSATYQRIPTLLDDMIASDGGERIAKRGASDVSKQDTFGDFEAWTANELWPALEVHLGSASSLSGETEKDGVRSGSRDRDSGYLSHEEGGPRYPSLDIEFITTPTRDDNQRAVHLQQQNMHWATVVDSRKLTGPGEPEKRHLEVALPEEMGVSSYTAGDYLAVLPLNPRQAVDRVMRYFNLPRDGRMVIKPHGGAAAATGLPTDVTIGISELLEGYVEISQPATRRDIEIILSLCSTTANKEETSSVVKKVLERYLEPEIFTAEVITKRITLFDIIFQCQQQQHDQGDTMTPQPLIPFSTFLALLPSMRTRLYSISSSPLVSPRTATLTYSILDAPAWYQPTPSATETGDPEQQRFLGVAGNYMRSLSRGDRMLVALRSSTNKFFRLPGEQDMKKTPIVMFANGSGLAPFRGFVQERAALLKNDNDKKKVELAPAVLFAGCRRQGKDQLYAEEFAEWEAMGAVDVRWVFSREEGEGQGQGRRYVQDRMEKDWEDVSRLWQAGAKFYICGSKELAKGVGKVTRRMILEAKRKNGKEVTVEEVDAFVKGMRNERYVVDIF